MCQISQRSLQRCHIKLHSTRVPFPFTMPGSDCVHTKCLVFAAVIVQRIYNLKIEPQSEEHGHAELYAISLRQISGDDPKTIKGQGGHKLRSHLERASFL